MSEGQDAHRLTAKQKMAMYLTTLCVVGFVYLAPEIFRFIAGLPDSAWRAIGISLAILAGGVIIVSLYAIWSVFSTAKRGIKKDAERERAEIAARAAEREKAEG